MLSLFRPRDEPPVHAKPCPSHPHGGWGCGVTPFHSFTNLLLSAEVPQVFRYAYLKALYSILKMKLGNLQGVTCRGVLGRYCRGLITCKGHKTNNLQVVTCRVLGRLQGVTCSVLSCRPPAEPTVQPTNFFTESQEAVLASFQQPSLPVSTSSGMGFGFGGRYTT